MFTSWIQGYLIAWDSVSNAVMLPVLCCLSKSCWGCHLWLFSPLAFREGLTLPLQLTAMTFLMTISELSLLKAFSVLCLCKGLRKFLGASDSQRAENVAETKCLDGARCYSPCACHSVLPATLSAWCCLDQTCLYPSSRGMLVGTSSS